MSELETLYQVSSYLLSWVHHTENKVVADLSSVKGCNFTPSENKNVGVLLIESKGKGEEELILEKLNQFAWIQSMVLVHSQQEIIKGDENGKS